MFEPEQKTHREVKEPKMQDRFLADYMAASERRRRSIVRDCKYPKIARVLQHKEAKLAVGKFIREGGDVQDLNDKSEELRNRLADDDFDRNLFDHNADYIDRFLKKVELGDMPASDILPEAENPSIELGGVAITADIPIRMQRKTKTNKIRIGGIALRYAKGKPVNIEAAYWQSAFIHGYLGKTWMGEDEAEPECKLCLTLDVVTGVFHSAPTDAVSRFANMTAGCATIAEMWPAIKPPPGAVI